MKKEEPVSRATPIFRAVRSLTDPERMREVYAHQIREYTKKPYNLDKENAEDKAKRDILFAAGQYDKETYNRWARTIKEHRRE